MNRPPPTVERTPLMPERVRRIAGQGFAFVPHRFLREGFFASVSPDELRLYFLLVLAADRFGVSYYHYDTLCTLLRVPLEPYLKARDGLIDKDLIAFDGTRFQVLSLPGRPLRSAPSGPSAPGRRDRGVEAVRTVQRRPGRSQPSAANEAREYDLRILHRKAHPDPGAHPECRHCQSSERVRQTLREAIAALEASSRVRRAAPIEPPHLEARSTDRASTLRNRDREK